MKSLTPLLICLISSSLFSQNIELKIQTIKKNSLEFILQGDVSDNIILEYGVTKNLELDSQKGLTLTGLKDATFYYVKAKNIANKNQTSIQLFSTASKSSGDITVYFNHWVNNNASSITDAIHIANFEDTLIAYIDRVQNTLDVCNYNTGSLPIVNAINAAKTRGVIVRYVSADNTGTNNGELSNLSAAIPMIQRPNDGEVMHNKFMIIDVATNNLAKIISGSTNHTNNSCTNDYNNLVIIEDQSLAQAYKLEFEEMWGSSSTTPNGTNAKFGNAKTDNTPHSFNIGGTTVELYFSPSDNVSSHIESSILTANTDMQFATLTFIHNAIGDAVTTIHNAGVDVKGIIENVFFWGSEYSGLLNDGVDVHSHFTTANLFHHKYGIIDANNISSDPLVITGSHNWTNSAENDYDENTLIIHDPIIANMYYEEFMARYSEATGAVGIEESLDDLSIQLFPNPTKKHLTIESAFSIENIRIHNVIGDAVYYSSNINQHKVVIDLRGFPQGVYFVQISTNSRRVVKKIVIQ
ncbi:MAG: T9SS type A sorting domain-containing protein [Flavobacteriales bacterium]|nr:T9SS type A sorting domain-containing protein [Flavobacteriales bacterium]